MLLKCSASISLDYLRARFSFGLREQERPGQSSRVSVQPVQFDQLIRFSRFIQFIQLLYRFIK
jgi:hypothetical protein